MKKNLLFLLETGQSKKIIKNMSLVVTCNLYPIMTITKIKKTYEKYISNNQNLSFLRFEWP